jgi:hypothetical protein
MTSLPPWANGPFELLVHAEGHLVCGEDFDRRIALISFDNAIEVAITTYLTLHPIQRGNRPYQKADVDRWLNNYHTKLDFLEAELIARGLSWSVEKSHIIWAHDHRNEQYHGGQKGAPEKSVLKLIRAAALWVFSVLYEVADVEALLSNAILDSVPPTAPSPDEAFNVAIDRKFGIIEVGEQSYYVSELLFAIDQVAYRDLGARLCNSGSNSESAEKEGGQE